MKELKINHLAVLAAVILQFVLGYLWYGPLFGQAWMDMEGLDMAAIQANPPGAGPWIMNIFATVAGIYLLAWILVKLGTDKLGKGLWLGFLFGFVWIQLSFMAGGMFSQDPYWLAWINGGYSTVALALSGAILGAWSKTK